MSEKTRTVTMWYNQDRVCLTLAVNPQQMTVSRAQSLREFRTITGAPIRVSQGQGLRQVRFSTFLPCTLSPFYTGTPPQTALALLHQWQDSRRTIRLVVSGTDVNSLFLLTQVNQTIAEGDQDIGIALELTEAGTTDSILPVGAGRANQLAARPDERVIPGTYTVQEGDTLWSIARNLYDDGTRWKEMAVKNNISHRIMLQAGQVLVL